MSGRRAANLTDNIKVRSQVFESNSSSTHSVSYGADEVLDLALLKESLRSGKYEITLPSEDFGWEWKRFYQPENKLSYLLLQACGGYCPSLPDDVRAGDDVTWIFEGAGYRVEALMRAVERFTGCNVRILAPEYGEAAGINHQSVGVGEDVLDGDGEDLARFIFSTDSYVETGNDNSSPPEKIPTDRGEDDYYYAAAQVNSVPDLEEFTLMERPVSDFGRFMMSVHAENGEYEPPTEMRWGQRSMIDDILKEDGVVVRGFDISMPFPHGMTYLQKQALARETAFEYVQEILATSKGMKLLRDFELTFHETEPVGSLPHKYQAQREAMVVMKAVAPGAVITRIADVIRQAALEADRKPSP